MKNRNKHLNQFYYFLNIEEVITTTNDYLNKETSSIDLDKTKYNCTTN